MIKNKKEENLRIKSIFIFNKQEEKKAKYLELKKKKRKLKIINLIKNK